MVALATWGNVQGFKIFKVILYIKYTKYGVSKTQAPQPPALQGLGFRSFKGDYGGVIEGIIMGVTKGDTRSLDYSSYSPCPHAPLQVSDGFCMLFCGNPEPKALNPRP